MEFNVFDKRSRRGIFVTFLLDKDDTEMPLSIISFWYLLGFRIFVLMFIVVSRPFDFLV